MLGLTWITTLCLVNPWAHFDPTMDVKICYGHGSKLASVILDLPLLFCPTSKVEHLNPTKSSKVSNVILIPPSTRKIHAHYVPQWHQERCMPYQLVIMLEVHAIGCYNMPRWHLHNMWWTSLGNTLKSPHLTWVIY